MPCREWHVLLALRRVLCLLASNPMDTSQSSCCSILFAASVAEENLISGRIGFISASCVVPGPAGVRDYGVSCLLGTLHLVCFCTGFSLKSKSQSH